jgi:ferredoxin--NADP+ reductase
MRHIAIIGSGPSGCYLADALLRLVPDCRIDVLDRLPVPFGLVRYGVAPDHQGTKAVARVFDRILARDRIGFFGHVEVGRDVRLAELEALYDAVVIATGAPLDRRLGIPGEDLPGVVGSGRFVGWYNGHPDHLQADFAAPRSAVVIGNGNVALDVARLLAKAPAEFDGSDLGADAAAFLRDAPLETIHIVGRRGPEDAKFTDHELEELASLERARPAVAAALPPAADTPRALILRGFQDLAPKPVALEFHFGLTPDAFLGTDRVEAVRFRDAERAAHVLPADLAVTCVGYQAQACCSENPRDGVFANDGGHVRDGLHVVGWAKRGPNGTIPTNRQEAQAVAQRIAAGLGAGGRAGGAGLRPLLDGRGVRWVDYDGWRRIEAHEVASADPGRCRRKLAAIADMLAVAGGSA